MLYLLDKAMQMEKIGLISTNLAEKIAMTVTEAPYRVTAETISSTCGQTISSGGVWNMMQRLGERISEEEKHAVKEMNADQNKEKKSYLYCLKKWMVCGFTCRTAIIKR